MEEKEIEVDLREVFYRICIHWRALILFMLVFAVLFGALGYKRAVDAPQKEAAETITELETAIEEQQKSIETLETVIEAIEKEPAKTEAAVEARETKLVEKKTQLAEAKADLASGRAGDIRYRGYQRTGFLPDCGRVYRVLQRCFFFKGV